MDIRGQIRERLREMKGTSSVPEMVKRTGIGRVMLYAILNGTRAPGVGTIELLLQNAPEVLDGIIVEDGDD